MKLEKINMNEVNGSSYMGDVTCKYEKLVKVFGNPQTGIFDGKVTCEWEGKLDGVLFTIYDWKTDVPYKENLNWNIGGFNQKAVNAVKLFLAENNS
jgi:hypothetical protein